MADSETVVAQTSSAAGYTSGAFESTDYVEAAVVSAGIGSVQGDVNTYNSDGPLEVKQLVENLPLDASQALAYDSSLNGNAINGNERNYGAMQNGIAVDVCGEDASAPAEQMLRDSSLPEISSEEERLWSIVRANSLDFNAWTALIDATEKTDTLLSIRRAYDAFLAEFPLCYGYWKKYADHEHRLGSIDKVMEVYERAVQGVTYSVDIWLHYCIFSINTYGDPETVRRLFERGLAYVGTDYLSYPLWDKYIEYDYSQQEWGRLAVIYTRILEHPNQQLDRYFNSFKELAGSRPLSELRTAEEAAAVDRVCMDAGAQGIDGQAHPDTMEQLSKPVSSGINEAEALEKYIAVREDLYRKAKEFDSKIIGFETSIRRPYFHVRPLSVAELENWDNYLDFIERGDDFNKVVKLYERCLIACANYPEYWIRYVLCMKASGSMDLANNALARATQVFVKRQPEIHLFAARFKEQHDDIEGARAAYQLVHSEISPGLLEAIIKHANMERRLGNLENAFLVYQQAIDIEKGKEHSQSLPMLFAQYSRFLFLASGDADKARDILFEAAEHVQLSKPVLEALIHLESFLPPPKRINHIDSLIEKFVSPSPESTTASASSSEREEISCIFLEFLDLFGDTASIQKADDRHARLFLHHRSTSVLRKRQAEDYLTPDKAKFCRSYPGMASSAQSLMGTYPSPQAQWAAGYALQPQTWPQVTQPQGQPWSSGYTQQAYGAYNSYPSQIPTSAPQAAAYGAYPPTYPVQAVPSQNYTPAATVAATAAVQDAQAAAAVAAAAVPQAYYGAYY